MSVDAVPWIPLVLAGLIGVAGIVGCVVDVLTNGWPDWPYTDDHRDDETIGRTCAGLEALGRASERAVER